MNLSHLASDNMLSKFCVEMMTPTLNLREKFSATFKAIHHQGSEAVREQKVRMGILNRPEELAKEATF